MYLSKLGFFREKKEIIAKQNLAENLNRLAANLKNNLLRRMLCAYLQQELYALTRQVLVKQKFKFTLRRRRVKKRLLLQNKQKARTKRRLCAGQKMVHGY